MHLSTALLGGLAALGSLVSANLSVVEQQFAAFYPVCAVKCLADRVPLSECFPTDLDCQCNSPTKLKETELCIAKSCSIFDSLQTKNTTMTMCEQPVRDKHLTPLIIALVGGALALLAFIMRIWTLFMRKSSRSVGADDYLAGAALLLAAPPTLTCFAFRDNGLGKDLWTLDLDQIKNVLMLYYLGSVFYIASISMVKMSLVFFMLRVFPDAQFRRLCYAIMAIVAAYGIAFTTATALQCWPVEYAWQRVDETHHGKCNNVHLQAWLAAICNIVLDLALLLLPLRSLWGLNMNLKKKLMIMSMFSLGVFVTIISIIRLHTLIKFANSQNISWDYVDAGYWSLVEMHASIICACLPYCRHLLISFGASFLKSADKTQARIYGSRTASRKPSEGPISSSGKMGEGEQTPKHGDEGDFVPLVEYPHRGWDKHMTVSTESMYDSGRSN